MDPIGVNRFFCTSLAQVAYEMQGVPTAREWLRKGISLNQMHAQGWTALAELEESEGKLEDARANYKEAIEFYENVRQHKKSRLGDKWRNVYMNWARLEEQSNVNEAGEIYLRAAQVFPNDWTILTRFATTMWNGKSRLSHTGVQSIFERACKVAGSRHADPHRLYALYESSLSNYIRARAIFFLGAETVLQSYIKEDRDDRGLSSLFCDWGRFEFKQMNQPKRARILLEEALRFAPLNHVDLRSKILCSIAELEVSCQNYYVAKHYACLSINESENKGSHSLKAWMIWAKACDGLGDEKMANNCRAQAKIQQRKEIHLFEDGSTLTSAGRSPRLFDDSNLKKMLCKTPWQKKMMIHKVRDVTFSQNCIK